MGYRVPHTVSTHRNNTPSCDSSSTFRQSAQCTPVSPLSRSPPSRSRSLPRPTSSPTSSTASARPTLCLREIADLPARRELQPERRDRCQHQEPWLPRRGRARRTSHPLASGPLALTTAHAERLHPEHWPRHDGRQPVLPGEDEQGHRVLVPVGRVRLYGDGLLCRARQERRELPVHLGEYPDWALI
jgi:hypothetical protein